MFLKSVSPVCYAVIDLKNADLYIYDGFDNGTSTPTTTAVEPIGESVIALTGMLSEVPDPTSYVGPTVTFGSDETIYTVTARTMGSGTDEVQTIEIDDDCSGGTFTLTYGSDTTGTIAYNAAAAVVEAALEALDSIGAGGATVTGSSPTWTVTFGGDLADTPCTLLVGDGALLTGGVVTDPVITETVAGVDAVSEIQTLTVTGTPTGGTLQLGFGGDTTAAIDYDATAAEVELALEALDSIPQGEATCAGGAWPGSAITVTFSGSLAGDQALITLEDNSLTGGTDPTCTPAETTPGVAAVQEVVTVAIPDSTTGGTFTLTHGGNESVPIAYNATAADVQTALTSAPVSQTVTVTGGDGPETDWVITWTTAGAQTAVTGTGTNLTGGSATSVDITRTVTGVAGTETTSITVSPVLVAPTTIGGSVTFGGRRLEVKIGDGNMSYTEAQAREYILDRDALDTVRNGPDTPVDLSFDFMWEWLSSVGTATIPTLKEVLKQQGNAADWLTTSDDACEPYCVDFTIHYDPACGENNTETIILNYFRWESLEHSLRDRRLTCSGKCNVTESVDSRGS